MAVWAVPKAVMRITSCFGFDGADVLERLQPAHPGHPDVQVDEVGRGPLLHGRDALLPAGGLRHDVAARGQHAGERVADLRVVVYDKDGG